MILIGSEPIAGPRPFSAITVIVAVVVVLTPLINPYLFKSAAVKLMT